MGEIGKCTLEGNLIAPCKNLSSYFPIIVKERGVGLNGKGSGTLGATAERSPPFHRVELRR